MNYLTQVQWIRDIPFSLEDFLSMWVVALLAKPIPWPMLFKLLIEGYMILSLFFFI
jgi:hypothetical protein